jgi:hypothetical protein
MAYKDTNTTGDIAKIQTLLYLDKVEVGEGVIIDTTTGAIGFCNHMVPTLPRMKHGATRTEHLLWIEPVTVCVDTNWAIRGR